MHFVLIHPIRSRPVCIAALGASLLFAIAGTEASAQTSTTATVTFEVQPISELSLSGSPAALTVSAAAPGAEPTAATDATTTWSITTNETNRKVTAAIDPLPEGVTLVVDMAAPPGATSAGSVRLGSTAVDLVTGISTVQASGLPITYMLTAATSAGVVAPTTTVVTFTITAGA